MTIPKPKYHPNPEKQSLPDLVSNEIVMRYYNDVKLLTAKDIAKSINSRLGTNYTEQEIQETTKAWATPIIEHKEFLVTKTMLAFPDYYLSIN